MKKGNLISCISVLLVLCLLVVSCKKKTDYISVIPADAPLVTSLDIPSIIKKSGIANNANLKNKLTALLKDGLNAEGMQYVEKVIQNPSESGISITDKVYIFSTQSRQIGLVAKVNSLSKLQNSIEVIQKEGVPVQNLSKINGYETITIGNNNNTYCCFDDTKLILLMNSGTGVSEGIKAEMERIVSLPAEQSMSANNGMVKMDGKKGDIVAYVNMDILPGSYVNMAKMNLPPNINLKDISVIGALNFENGRVSFTGENYTENEEVKKWYKKSASIVLKMNNSFADYFPATLLYYIGMNMNGVKLNELLADNPQYQQSVSSLKAQGIELDKIFSSINGDISIGLNSLNFRGVPEVSMYANVDGNEVLNAINNAVTASKGRLTTIDSNNYSINIAPGTNAYYGMKDNYFYFTTILGGNNVVGKKIDNSFSSEKWASLAKESTFYTVINVKEIFNLPFLGMIFSSGDPKALMIKNVFSQFDYLEIATKSPQEFIANIETINKDTNSLQQFISLIEILTGMN